MAAKMTTEVTVEVHHMPIYPDLLARAERLVSEDNQETEKAVKALLCSETPPPVQGTNCCVSEIGEIEIERETSALQHGTDSSKQTNKLSRQKTCETARRTEVDCTSGTHGSSTLPFTRSFRTCEADKETVEGDTGGNDHPQQQHKHHESVRQPSFNRVDGDTAGYNHPQHSTSTTRAFLIRSLTGLRIQAATFIPNTPRQ
ncbi:hypothetical protein D4764_14G0005870, partial [Takifugu flavidus]